MKTTTKRKKNPTRRAKSAKRKTAAAPVGLLFPGRVIPLAVYAAWKARDWSMMKEEKIYFSIGYKSKRVTVNPRQHQPAHLHEDLGELPDGWDSVDLRHEESDLDETFVGPAPLIAKLKLLQKTRDGSDEEIGRLIHTNR